MLLALVVLAPFAAAAAPLAVAGLHARRYLRIVLAAVAALAPTLMIARVDALSLGFAALVSALALLAVAFSVGRGLFARTTQDVVGAREEAGAWSRVSVYFLLLGAFWSAMLLTVLASNFALLWLGISATTLATAFLVAFGGESTALEAAWKYLILCSVGIAFALLGLLLLGHLALGAGIDPAHALAWDTIVATGRAGDPSLARLAIALMLLGFGTKAGLAPMHAWLPDAHSKAPAPVSALLSGVLVSCALYAIFRTVEVANALGAGPFARETLVWLGALSTVVAGSLMLAQSDMKRLLAYSTVEHAGVVALALGFGGPLGRLAALVHVVAHGCSKAAAFFATGIVQSETGTTAIAGLRGLWRASSAGRLLLAALGALGGLPPFGIFVSEFLLVLAGAAAGRWVALGVGLFGLALAFAALARTAIAIESGAPAGSRVRIVWVGPGSASTAAAVTALLAALGTALLPWTPFADGLQAAAHTLAGRFP